VASLVDILVGEFIVNKLAEVGTITAFDGQYITVAYNDRTATFIADAFEKGHIRYLNEDLQKKVEESIAQAKQEAAQKAEEARIAAEKEKQAQKEKTLRAVAPSNAITIEETELLIDPAPVYLNSVYKNDKQLVQEIFDECDRDTKNLYASFQPRMVYPKFTSQSRSKFCVGFLCKYKDAYVFRVFSRNDVYKRRISTGVTVMKSNTAEVLRVLQVNGKLYHFSKNIAVSMGYYNNTDGNPKWRGSDMGTNVFLNEVICNCDCGYLNGHITDPKVNTEAFLFINLLFLALVNNKVEIVFKNKAFDSTYRIKNLAKYLDDFTSKQIDLASKNDVLHALPFIKQFGVSDIALLRDLESVMCEIHYGDSVHEYLVRMYARLGLDCADLDRRLMNFVKNVEHFNAAVYFDYLQELNRQPAIGLTLQDLFDRNYVERHDTLLRERMELSYQQEQKENEEYCKAAKELSWIDREENGYFITVPKTIMDFKIEGAGQHNCVYKLRYYRHVVNRRSIIVFLRQEKTAPYVTIEYDYQTFAVRQALGKYNKRIDPELYQYVVKLGKQLYYERHTQQ
jgi:hypothetical protein